MISYESRAQILSEALPYIQKFSGKTLVIKYGGNAMVNEIMRNAVVSDCLLLSLVGIHVVLVHGGGPEINEMMEKVGKESRFINGLRYTDNETVEIVQMVLAGKVNKNLVSIVNAAGGKAIGLCGIDAELLKCKKTIDQNGTDYGYVGEVTDVNEKLILDCLKDGYMPVIATVACGEDGHAYNVNADTAAAKIAGKINAEKIILLTDTKGVLKNKEDESTLISRIKTTDISGYIQDGFIQGGMIPKINCCATAIQEGVKSAHILDGRVEHSVLIEVLTEKGIGTMIYEEGKYNEF